MWVFQSLIEVKNFAVERDASVLWLRRERLLTVDN